MAKVAHQFLHEEYSKVLWKFCAVANDRQSDSNAGFVKKYFVVCDYMFVSLSISVAH